MDAKSHDHTFDSMTHPAVSAVGMFVDPWLKVYNSWVDNFLSDEDSLMRKYIRHPSDIPIEFSVEELPVNAAPCPRLKDVSLGGLCFSADCPLKSGTPIHIEIPVENKGFGADGVIAWCRPDGSKYSVGVQFTDSTTKFSVRMVEQICHIEHYRTEVARREGRELTSEEAATEWVAKFAADFPDLK